jgi:hypothetical protein
VAALPTHLFLATHAFGPGAVGPGGLLAWAGSTQGIVASLSVVVAVGLVATFVPLLLGLRSFRQLEP